MTACSSPSSIPTQFDAIERIAIRTVLVHDQRIAYLDVGVVAKVVKCPQGGSFCRVETGNYDGWLKRDEIWGVYPGEHIE